MDVTDSRRASAVDGAQPGNGIGKVGGCMWKLHKDDTISFRRPHRLSHRGILVSRGHRFHPSRGDVQHKHPRCSMSFVCFSPIWFPLSFGFPSTSIVLRCTRLCAYLSIFLPSQLDGFLLWRLGYVHHAHVRFVPRARREPSVAQRRTVHLRRHLHFAGHATSVPHFQQRRFRIAIAATSRPKRPFPARRRAFHVVVGVARMRRCACHAPGSSCDPQRSHGSLLHCVAHEIATCDAHRRDVAATKRGGCDVRRAQNGVQQRFHVVARVTCVGEVGMAQGRVSHGARESHGACDGHPQGRRGTWCCDHGCCIPYMGEVGDSKGVMLVSSAAHTSSKLDAGYRMQ
mmetsp:Transcript_6302/g.39237  ORF Transcript_6302/g.39237 Transcript_6302/m.39237 type:complete len:343 (+) Transcript_6302:3325-4353(+)